MIHRAALRSSKWPRALLTQSRFLSIGARAAMQMRARTFPAYLADFVDFHVDEGGRRALHATVVRDHLEDVIVRLFPDERPRVLDVAVRVDFERRREFVAADDFVFANFAILGRTVVIERFDLDDRVDHAALVDGDRIGLLAEHGRVFVDVFDRDVHGDAA